MIESDENNQLVRYIEKPTYNFDVSMGVNVLNKNAIKPYLKSGEYLDIPDLMLKLCKDGHPVHCYREPCYWLDIGRIDDYRTATEIFESRQAEFLPNMPCEP